MSVAAPQQLTGTFAADATHSSLRFSVRHMKVSTFTASFEDLTAQAVADDQGVRMEGAVAVESVSIKTPREFRDHVVYGADFFDAANHPRITFHAGDVRLEGDGTATVGGELTIKQITKPFTATGIYREPVQDPWGATRVGVEFTATVDRRDWGLTWQAPLPGGGDALGYHVEVHAQIELIRQD